MDRDSGKDAELIRREFAQKRTRHAVASLAIVALVLTLAISLGSGVRSAWLLAPAVVLAIVTGFAYSNWRCPACGNYLGSRTPKHCAECGTPLT